MHVPAATGWAFLADVRLAGPAIDGDKPHACFNHSARKQKVLAERMHAVTFAHLCGLAFKVKRFPALRTRHGIVGLLTQVRPILT